MRIICWLAIVVGAGFAGAGIYELLNPEVSFPIIILICFGVGNAIGALGGYLMEEFLE